MKIIEASSYKDLSAKAAMLFVAQMVEKPNSVLGLATGSSPIGLYQELIDYYKKGIISFKDVVSFNLDEYVGLPKTHKESYDYFMHDQLFNHVDIKEENIHVPNGIFTDANAECDKYEALIKAAGGIDIQLLGIGVNAHIGFNEPSDVFAKKTHRVDLKEETIQANARFFGSEEEVPKEAVTMGISTIMAAKKVVLIASGENKFDALEKTINGPVTPEVPASALQYHPDTTIIFCKTSS